jgi:hypothetical protein
MRYLITSIVIVFFLLNPCDIYSNSMQDAIKIAPYGNSITQGANNRPTYRYPLWKKLIDKNIAFDFVGSMKTNFGGEPSRPDYKGKAFDKDHEGHWGWKADEILSKMNSWLTQYTPDMVLLHIGTNDCIGGQNTSSTQNEITQIITNLRNDNPKVVLFLATLIPCNQSANASNLVKDLNTKIKTMSSQLTTQASPVILVDQFTGIDASKDLYDGIHQGATGEEKMAQKWFDAIDKYLTSTQTNKMFALNNTRSFAKASAYQLELVCSQNTLDKGVPFTINGSVTNLLGKTMLRANGTVNRTSGVYIISNPEHK